MSFGIISLCRGGGRRRTLLSPLPDFCAAKAENDIPSLRSAHRSEYISLIVFSFFLGGGRKCHQRSSIPPPSSSYKNTQEQKGKPFIFGLSQQRFPRIMESWKGEKFKLFSCATLMLFCPFCEKPEIFFCVSVSRDRDGVKLFSPLFRGKRSSVNDVFWRLLIFSPFESANFLGGIKDWIRWGRSISLSQVVRYLEERWDDDLPGKRRKEKMEIWNWEKQSCQAYQEVKTYFNWHQTKLLKISFYRVFL